MKHPLPNLLGGIIRDYFTDHLPGLRGTSPNTIHSYRDSIVLLLRFLSEQRKKPVTGLDLTDLDPSGILAFLSHLEQERKNRVSTRNVRLSAIHAFFHFVASRNPEYLDLAQRVLGIPFKRAQQRAIDYLEYEEIDSILNAINRSTLQGSRDYALLATMFNTGARVQEIADLRAADLHPLGLGCLSSTTSQGLARIAAYSHRGRESRYPINFAASRVVYRRFKMASAASFWLPRGNFANSLPVITEINPSRISSCTSSLNLSINEILRLTQLLSLPTKAAISTCVNPSSR